MAELRPMLDECLFTRRLILRRIIESDLPLILEWSNRETAYGSYLTPEKHTEKSLKELFAGNGLWNRNDKTFLVQVRSQENPIGTIHYWLKQNQPEASVVSVKIAEAQERGKGYGTEAQKFLIIHLFDKVGVKTVEMYTDQENAPQQHCLNKLGFSLIDSLTYSDRQVMRTGYLYQLSRIDYQEKSIYRFHYE